MEELVKKYANKLYIHGLTEIDAPTIGALETEIYWNKLHPEQEKLEEIFNSLNINSLLLSKPKEPYNSIINYLVSTNEKTIYPKDCETRTFIHDLPIARSFNINEIVKILSDRKSVIIKDVGIMTYGTVSPEQAFVVFSSVCFASYVKFFSDYLNNLKLGAASQKENDLYNFCKDLFPKYPEQLPSLFEGNIDSEEKAYRAIIEAGKATVDLGLVDSYFGNISYRLNNTLFISQTGSSLDELSGCIDPCPLDNSTCCGITASSELTAHKEIVLNSEKKAIVHGHPKFAVIMSMNCLKENCKNAGSCHIKCTEERKIAGIKIVPGEVGTGRFGICNTIPPILQKERGVIVYGHGIFSASNESNFIESFKDLLEIEKKCFDTYLEEVENYSK